MSAPPRILIVEDEVLVARDLARRLTRLGYRLAGFAATAAEAVSHARELRPDVVLMDIHLRGDMDGIEAAQVIGAWAPIPVVYVSAYADPATAARIQEAGAAGYLQKPVADWTLAQTLGRVLSFSPQDPP
jgi:CheY-like chemotaxis protein